MSEKLFQNSDVIRLTDKDFFFAPNNVKLKNKEFANKNGYIMAYASWCPYCQAKEDFWSYLATQFNKNPEYKKEKFRIGIIDGEDPQTKKIREALAIQGIPRFFQVVANPMTPGQEDLIDYVGEDLSPESLIMAVCENSPDGSMCQFKSDQLKAPKIPF